MDPSTPDDLTRRGADALTQHDYAHALSCFTAALGQRPDDLSLRCYEVAALLGLARYAEALEKIDAILAGTPLDAVNRAHILVGKANALAGLDRWHEAEQVIEEALQVLKEHANAWVLRARIALHAGDHKKSLESLRKAIEAGLSGSHLDAHQRVSDERQPESIGDPGGHQGSLVVAALGISRRVQRHRHDDRPPTTPVLRWRTHPACHC